MIYAPTSIIVGVYFERWRALVAGITSCGSGVGTLVLPPLLSMIMRKRGWRTVYRVISGELPPLFLLLFPP